MTKIKHNFLLGVIVCSFVFLTPLTSSAFSMLSMSQSNITLKAGENATISIFGNGGYYVSGNSNSNIASGYISANTLVVSAGSQGGTNITVCQDGSNCAVVYVYVDGVSAAILIPPTLSSIMISSQGPFMKVGSVTSLTFNSNVPVKNVFVNIAGTVVPTTGTSSGSYIASYKITGNEATPLPVVIGFSDLSDVSFQTSLTIQASSVAKTVPATPSAPMPVPPTASVPKPTVTYKFEKPLSLNSKGVDVSELQKILTKEGVYSGPITGLFGPLTEAGVKKFQIKYKLSPMGSVGPGTRAALNSLVY